MSDNQNPNQAYGEHPSYDSPQPFSNPQPYGNGQAYGNAQTQQPYQPYQPYSNAQQPYGDQPQQFYGNPNAFPQPQQYGNPQPPFNYMSPQPYPLRPAKSGFPWLMIFLVFLPLLIAGVGIVIAVLVVSDVGNNVNTLGTTSIRTASAADAAGLSTAYASNTSGILTAAAINTAGMSTASANRTARMATANDAITAGMATANDAITAGMATVAAVQTALVQQQPSEATATATAQATKVPTKAPASAHIGETVHQDGYALTVLAVERVDVYQTVIKPKPGDVFLAVNLKITSEGGSNVDSSLNSARLKDGQGHTYPWSIGKDPMLGLELNMPVGTTATGWVTFDVPKDAAGLVFEYDTTLGGSTKIHVVLDK